MTTYTHTVGFGLTGPFFQNYSRLGRSPKARVRMIPSKPLNTNTNYIPVCDEALHWFKSETLRAHAIVCHTAGIWHSRCLSSGRHLSDGIVIRHQCQYHPVLVSITQYPISQYWYRSNPTKRMLWHRPDNVPVIQPKASQHKINEQQIKHWWQLISDIRNEWVSRV